MIEAMPPGWSEFGCHVGYTGGLDSVYAAEREEELRVLCARELPEILARSGVKLQSFHDLKL
jgi:predicted glycoside hydrolase/deacetylase ChbG (UPF0249 family)